ncbi:Cleavage and polyadenylation specificity factor subunit 6 [Bagarius yarrelli]|uniref:Cleavage and polyadenylation specificity factor subunit 6 n=1 Tax=Bagarius yarrelli TaxID=175774 RepID=A0A556U338_BAGYA|nr:Cleavage and polyadenylation specificity factor subunit 6 [Bagarius yarrelli]
MAAEKEDGAAQELLDLYGDLNSEEAGSLEAEADALYDDVLTGSVDSESALKKREHREDVKLAAECGDLNNHSVYIGNFTWWMSDKDLITIAGKHGVRDILKIKFAENRTNGLSKG